MAGSVTMIVPGRWSTKVRWARYAAPRACENGIPGRDIMLMLLTRAHSATAHRCKASTSVKGGGGAGAVNRRWSIAVSNVATP